jgi:hypothetical protein
MPKMHAMAAWPQRAERERPALSLRCENAAAADIKAFGD